jgi:hypothetical protein
MKCAEERVAGKWGPVLLLVVCFQWSIQCHGTVHATLLYSGSILLRVLFDSSYITIYFRMS